MLTEENIEMKEGEIQNTEALFHVSKVKWYNSNMLRKAKDQFEGASPLNGTYSRMIKIPSFLSTNIYWLLLMLQYC